MQTSPSNPSSLQHTPESRFLPLGAFTIREGMSTLTNDHVRGTLRVIADTQDWSTCFTEFRDSIVVSSLR